MCLGGKSSSQPQQQQIPAPTQGTTFNYNPPRDAQQRAADSAVSNVQSATMLSSTTGSPFGSELGGGTTNKGAA